MRKGTSPDTSPAATTVSSSTTSSSSIHRDLRFEWRLHMIGRVLLHAKQIVAAEGEADSSAAVTGRSNSAADTTSTAAAAPVRRRLSLNISHHVLRWLGPCISPPSLSAFLAHNAPHCYTEVGIEAA